MNVEEFQREVISNLESFRKYWNEFSNSEQFPKNLDFMEWMEQFEFFWQAKKSK